MRLWVFWESMDKKSKSRAEMRPELQKKVRTVATIKSFVEELHVENQSNEFMSRAKKGDPMDIGAMSRGPGQEEPRYTAEEWEDYFRSGEF